MGGKVYKIPEKLRIYKNVLHFEQHPHEAENSWKFHIFRWANSHVGVIQYF